MKWFVAETTFMGKKTGMLIHQKKKLQKSEPAAVCSQNKAKNILRWEERPSQNRDADGWQISSKVQFSKLPQSQSSIPFSF